MKLYVESLLPVDPNTAWDLFESEEFERRLAERTNITSTKIEETPREPGVTFRLLRYRSGKDLPVVVAKALGQSNLSYDQHNVMNRNTGRLDWTVHLPVLSDRVKVSGSTTITAVPSGGCRRVVDGDISVQMRLVGGQIEKVVAGEFEKSMARAVDIVRELIAERGLGNA